MNDIIKLSLLGIERKKHYEKAVDFSRYDYLYFVVTIIVHKKLQSKKYV